jgi:hypothetical protein
MSELSPVPPAQAQPVPAEECPHCGNIVPTGLFCGACGAHLSHPGDRLARRRPHSYAAFPDEPVFHLSLVSSLFPHLAHRRAATFRLAAAVLVGLLLLFSATDLEAPVVAVAALGLPLLFQLYVYEVDVYEDHRAGLSALTLLAGAALGVGWALLGGPVVASALAPSLVHHLIGGKSVEAAVVVPTIGEILMCVPMVAAVLSRRSLLQNGEPLDGFALGAASALGFTFAAILTNMASILSGGVFPGRTFVSLGSEALVRGLAEPVTAAAATGLIGLSLWRWLSPGTRSTWLASPLVALVVALAVQIGEGFADQARLDDIPLLLVHLAGAGVLLLALRAGVHGVLLAEERAVTAGPPRVCPHCHHLVPAMPFCPACGVAEGATPKRHRREGASEAQPWPLAPTAGAASAVWGGYPLVAEAISPAGQRSRHVVLLSTVLAGVAILAVALSLTAVLEAPSSKPAVHCRILCLGTDRLGAISPDGAPVRTYYLSGGGISVALWPASPLVNPGIFAVSASSSSSVLTVHLAGSSGTLNGKSVTIDGGTVQFVGVKGAGASPAQDLVDTLVQKTVPSAQLVYPVPDALVGYQAGYGAVYDLNAISASGQAVEDRLFVAAAVRGGDAAIVWAYGPYDPGFAAKGLLLHPSFVDLDIALVLDPMINSVSWGR